MEKQDLRDPSKGIDVPDKGGSPSGASEPGETAALAAGGAPLLGALSAALVSPALLVADVVNIVADYAQSPLWSRRHSVRVVAMEADGTCAVVMPYPGWVTLRAHDPLPSKGVVSFDVVLARSEAETDRLERDDFCAVGVVFAESAADTTGERFCVGNCHSFSICSLGSAHHHQSVGRNGPVSFGLGDVIRTEIDHVARTIGFSRNGGPCSMVFAAGAPHVGSEDPLYGRSSGTVGWPADGLFFPCVTVTFSSVTAPVRVALNDLSLAR
jgi:hypothetical protein